MKAEGDPTSTKRGKCLTVFQVRTYAVTEKRYLESQTEVFK